MLVAVRRLIDGEESRHLRTRGARYSDRKIERREERKREAAGRTFNIIIVSRLEQLERALRRHVKHAERLEKPDREPREPRQDFSTLSVFDL